MSPILFQTALHASLALCALGLLWRVSAWFRLGIGDEARSLSCLQRAAAAGRGVAAALLSRRVSRLIGAFFLDTLLLRRLFAQEKLRWFGHLLIAAGFTLMVLMHALAPVVTAKLFDDYQPTLAPYLFLRDLFGVMIFAGLALFLFGRWRRRTDFPSARRPGDRIFLLLLGVVLVSGFLLAAHKIASPRVFYRMADQYVGLSDPEKLRPLRAVWANDFGVAFADVKTPPDPGLIERGRELHRDACASCHAKPASAFVSYPVARALTPVIGLLDQGRADAWLLYLHVFACFFGLASLPFTRFFHVVAAPVSLLVNAAAPNGGYSVAARASRRAQALDACVRCGICDQRCAVAPLARYLGNPLLLPSHKLIATGDLASHRLLRAGRDEHALNAADGAFLCTDCGRCATRCPVGLDLDDLWEAGRCDLAAADLAQPARWVKARPALAWAELVEADRGAHAVSAADASRAPLAAERSAFSRCVQCQACTNVCPVVAHSMETEQGVDLTPQKVMNLLRLDLGDLTLGSRMVWDCAACYQCQQYCPEGIRVTDIMCELRALAVHRLGSVRALEVRA